MKKVLLVVLSIIFCSCAGTQKLSNPNWEKIIDKTLSASVLIEIPIIVYIPEEDRIIETNMVGSGVVVSSDGWIITNAHVVDKMPSTNPFVFIDTWEIGSVRFQDERIFAIEKSFVFIKDDIAILKINAKNLNFLQIRSSSLIVGEPCMSLGNPFPYTYVVKEGIVSRLLLKEYISLKCRNHPELCQEEDENSFKLSVGGVFVHTATIHGGNSGGAVIDEKGNLIGINEAGYPDSSTYGLAIPMKTVIHLLDMVGEDVYKKIYTLTN